MQNKIIPIFLANKNKRVVAVLPCDPKKPMTKCPHPRLNSKPMTINEPGKTRRWSKLKPVVMVVDNAGLYLYYNDKWF